VYAHRLGLVKGLSHSSKIHARGPGFRGTEEKLEERKIHLKTEGEPGPQCSTTSATVVSHSQLQQMGDKKKGN